MITRAQASQRVKNLEAVVKVEEPERNPRYKECKDWPEVAAELRSYAAKVDADLVVGEVGELRVVKPDLASLCRSSRTALKEWCKARIA